MMLNNEIKKMEVPSKEQQKQLRLFPKLLLSNYLNTINICNFFIETNCILQKQLESYAFTNECSEDEIQSLTKQIQELKSENEALRQKLINTPQIGRPQKYDAKARKNIVDFYNESNEHTYKVTADYFKISTSTLKEILNEARAKGITVRSRK